jgi:hypothetical protein
MKNTTSKRVLVLASPQGQLTMRRADHFRRFPDDYARHWQKLIHFRLKPGDSFTDYRDWVYGWAIHAYEL